MTISLAQYFMGRDETYPLAMTPDIEREAARTVDLANRLCALAQDAGVELIEKPGSPWGLVASGWRPPVVNAATPGASKFSHHMAGRAIDLYDPAGKLGRWLETNTHILKTLGLWMESPAATVRWAHLQTRPPGSGARIFIP